MRSTGRARPALTRTILLVDEDTTEVGDYWLCLLLEGCDVRVCTSYLEGLRRFEAERFDFIVVGQGSSEFEGRAVLQRAKEVDRYIPVLVVARALGMNCYIEAMHLGALDYLEKPSTAS